MNNIITTQLEAEWERFDKELAISQVENSNISATQRCFDDVAKAIRSGKLTGVHGSDTLIPDLENYDFTDGRAVGPVMVRLAKSGLIEKMLGHTRKSRRKGNHDSTTQLYIIL